MKYTAKFFERLVCEWNGGSAPPGIPLPDYLARELDACKTLEAKMAACLNAKVAAKRRYEEELMRVDLVVEEIQSQCSHRITHFNEADSDSYTVCQVCGKIL